MTKITKNILKKSLNNKYKHIKKTVYDIIDNLDITEINNDLIKCKNEIEYITHHVKSFVDAALNLKK